MTSTHRPTQRGFLSAITAKLGAREAQDAGFVGPVAPEQRRRRSHNLIDLPHIWAEKLDRDFDESVRAQVELATSTQAVRAARQRWLQRDVARALALEHAPTLKSRSRWQAACRTAEWLRAAGRTFEVCTVDRWLKAAGWKPSP